MSSVLLAAAAAAATAPAITAEEALEKARALYSVETQRQRARRCPDPKPGEILVCREREDPDKLRVPSDTDLGDPDDRMARAPDVSFLPHWSQGVRVGRKPPDPLIIDLKAIPEAPPGSDADRIAKGEMAPP
jgi:hypothetical protein